MKNLVIIGPGGIGGTIAALLARTGECEVTIIGRPGTHIDTIQKNGLRLTGLVTTQATTSLMCQGFRRITKHSPKNQNPVFMRVCGKHGKRAFCRNPRNTGLIGLCSYKKGKEKT